MKSKNQNIREWKLNFNKPAVDAAFVEWNYNNLMTNLNCDKISLKSKCNECPIGQKGLKNQPFLLQMPNGHYKGAFWQSLRFLISTLNGCDYTQWD